jgi:sarcosine oxidase subunit beta
MTEVAIVGGGVIGCSLALELARLGLHTTVIDSNGEVGHGSTSASCGIVRHYYSAPTMTAMVVEAAAIWSEWRAWLGIDDEGGLARFVRSGMLFIPPELDDDVDRILGHMQELGVHAERLPPEEIVRRFPYFDVRSHWPVRAPDDEGFLEDTGRSLRGAIFERDAGYVVSPLVATHNLRVACEEVGVTFRLGRRVGAIGQGGARRFRLELEDESALEADVVVNAAGPHSGLVNRLAGVTLPIETRPLRREVHAVENPAHPEASVPVVGDIDSGIYFRPEAGGRQIIVGSLDPECDAMEWVDDPDEWNADCTEAGYRRQVMRLMKRFPQARLGRRQGIAGLYDVTVQDWNPVLDRTDVPGYYVAIGTSGSSFKTAPVIGTVMARLIEACEAGHEHDSDPLRLTLTRSGFELDMGFFSRLRGAHRSSGTVLA